MKIVIIGCGGFIGSHLLEALIAKGGHELVGWDICFEKITHLQDEPSLKLRYGDIYEQDNFKKLRSDIDRADVVFNLAAICNPAEYNTRPLDVIRSNFINPYPVFEACAVSGTWMIHTSTSEVYGRTLSSYVNDYSDSSLYELREDETPLIMGPIHNQRWTYASAKQLQERLIYAFGDEYGLPYTIIRPLNFFGPRMDYLPGRDREGTPRVLACFLGALLDNKPMQLVDGGHARRTITSIHDAINAFLKILELPHVAQTQIFNIGNRNNEVSMLELAEEMRQSYYRITGDKQSLEHPIVEVSSEEFYGKGYEDCDRRMPNVSKAEHLLDWKAAIPLKDILDETIAYYIKKHQNACKRKQTIKKELYVC